MTIRLNPQPPYPMTSDEFLVWASEHDVGRVELIDGEVVAMAGGTRGHTRYKINVRDAIRAAFGGRETLCETYVDGLAVKIDERTTFIPDVVVDCAEHQDDSDLLCGDPVIVVEVLSESTSRKDLNAKLVGYFDVPSILHYLIVDAASRRVVYYRRGEEGYVARILASGKLTLDPPGIVLDVADFWAGSSSGAAS